MRVYLLQVTHRSPLHIIIDENNRVLREGVQQRTSISMEIHGLALVRDVMPFFVLLIHKCNSYSCASNADETGNAEN